MSDSTKSQQPKLLDQGQQVIRLRHYSIRTERSYVDCVKNKQAFAQTNHLPFDRLRVNGDMLKSFNFSAHAELVEA